MAIYLAVAYVARVTKGTFSHAFTINRLLNAALLSALAML